MAEFTKYKAHGVGNLLRHNNRLPNDGVQHSNTDIDNERTMYNYHLKKGKAEDVRRRLSEIFFIPNSSATVLGEMIVTLPKDVKKEDERDFFRAVYDFYCNDFGEENMINAVVHKDEHTPHIHIDFVPVLKGDVSFSENSTKQKLLEKWKAEHPASLERLCCKNLVTRSYLKTMHDRLSDYVEDQIGYKTGILNGATENRNKTILQLKIETLEKEIERFEKQKSFLQDDILKIHTAAKKWGIEESDIALMPLMHKIDDLENQNRILQEIISRQGYSYTKNDLERLRTKKFEPAKSVPIGIYDGSITKADIDNNAIVVIELADQKPRPSPQQELINRDNDLFRQTRLVQQSDAKIMMRNSRTSDKLYLFMKADNEQQTIENLFMLERQLQKADLRNRRLYMDRMENDKYDFAVSVLTKLELPIQYYVRKEVQEDKVHAMQKERME